jgi:hypothetical protein
VVLLSFFLSATSQVAEETADYSQAEIMVDFLRGASEGRLDIDLIDSIMASEGTSLIIEQQNRRAQIDSAQYRRILEGVLNQDAPTVAPLDSTERALLGVHRLQNEVWRVLKWGIENIGLLEKELIRLKEMDVAPESMAIAESYLPYPLGSPPSILFVAGGRAGFFAADNSIYMDLLLMSFSKTRRGEPLISRKEVVAYFAHEMHHVGFHSLMDRLRGSLTLEKRGERALVFISGLVAEGSATYLINGDRNIENIKEGKSYAKFFEMDGGLLRLCDEVLRAILDREIENDDEYFVATRPLLGMGFHAAGSLMMHVIDRGSGLESIKKILEDPRLLLQEYNSAVEKIQSSPATDGVYRFDEETTERIAELVGIVIEQ